MYLKTNWIRGQIACFSPDDLISKSLIYYGEWAETEIQFILNNLIKDGDFFIDIGAYIGTHSISLSLACPNSQGIAIEANPISYELLNENLSTHHIINIRTINSAASDADGDNLFMLSDPINLGNSIATKEETSKSKPVKSLTLDALHIERVDFIKIDVEGMESLVLKGGHTLISTFKPNIFFELATLKEHSFVIDYANTMGYKVYGFLFDAFNKHNFKGSSENIFGASKELALILSVKDLPNISYAERGAYGLVKIETLDDLAYLLSTKPQYLRAGNYCGSKYLYSATCLSIAKAEADEAKHAAEIANEAALNARVEADKATAKANQANAKLKAIYNSRSWKLMQIILGMAGRANKLIV